VIFDRRSGAAEAVYRLDATAGDDTPEVIGAALAELIAAAPEVRLLRIACPWNVDDYVLGVEASSDVGHVQHAALAAHLDGQRARLRERAPHVAELCVAVRVVPRPLDGSRPVTMAGLLAAEASLGRRLRALLPCDRLTERELEWLWLRAGLRAAAGAAAAEPPWRPARCLPRAGGALIAVEPRSVAPPWSIEAEDDVLRVCAPDRCTHQAFVRLTRFETGAGAAVEDPLDELDFPVDAAMLVRPGRPGRVRVGMSLAVAAASRGELEDRVARVCAAYMRHGAQPAQVSAAREFLAHVPGCRASTLPAGRAVSLRRAGAAARALRPTPRTDGGPCIGYRPGGSRAPVVLDVTREPRAGGAPLVLVTGGAGTGKTACVKLLMYEAFLTGTLVCDVDPAGEHDLGRLPGARRRLDQRALAGDASSEGVLDPLRVAPAAVRVELATDFLLAVLPAAQARDSAAAVRAAVARVAAGGEATCGAAIAALGCGGPRARAAAAALERRTAAGVARLGVAAAADRDVDMARHPILSLQLDAAAWPHRAGAGAHGRLGSALVRLMLAYAIALIGRDRSRHALLCVEGAAPLLDDPAGRSLLRAICAPGVGRDCTLLLVTRTVPEARRLRGWLGPVFCFRPGGERADAADNALSLLGLRRGDHRARQSLAGLPAGGCLLRDTFGRVSPLQIDPHDPALAEALALPTAG
jgi:hypothetical protein